ncbi:DNA N-6-adenine-methyltransferase [Xanthobacteraceae bacterium Astr-EGSB]|uniref:DNA N-6-adenine-methyltransferase n=1 Tax=Astrobacterium formosum TaxID=3069710 RepID=UPI0027B83A41|nr:DNA N-6-adenine-methyltransferase [Xanthobacteraceae bacterium Astr-EGSB]
MTLGSHQTTIGKSQVAITPRWILDPLGAFDLDPCGNDPRPWDCATVTFTEADDGLARDWFGRVWLNPPFDRRVVGAFIDRLTRHGRGTALVHVRTETDWFGGIWRHASALLFLAGRVIFHAPDGDHLRIVNPEAKHFGKVANSGAPVVLAAFGMDDADVLALCGIAGHFVPLRIPRSVLVAAIEPTWREVVLGWLRCQNGPVVVADLYRVLAGHSKARGNPNWRPKIRQTLQRGAGRRVGRNQWVAP